MKKGMVALIAAVCLVAAPVSVLAEETDYSYLEDMTVRELKELRRQIDIVLGVDDKYETTDKEENEVEVEVEVEENTDDNGFEYNVETMPYLGAVKAYHVFADGAPTYAKLSRVLYSSEMSTRSLYKMWFSDGSTLIFSCNKKTGDVEGLNQVDLNNPLINTFNKFFTANEGHNYYELDADYISKENMIQ